MPNYLKVYEVGPRDGLQNEAALISTDQKKKVIRGLVEAGLRSIELTSFVHPKAVPQMADADELMRDTLAEYKAPDRTPAPEFIGLVFNERGYERALAAGSRSIAIGAAVSESFSQANTNMSTGEALDMCRKLAEWARRDGVWTRAYISTAWVCPFEGYVRPEKVIAYAEKLWESGVDELALADTIGHASPLDVGALMEELGKRLDMSKLAVHLHDTQAMGLVNTAPSPGCHAGERHDTQAMGLVNTAAAIQAGVRIHDASIGGLGGCPFAPGAAGNLATEDLVFLAYRMGLGTGVDFPALWDIVSDLEMMVGRRVGGRIRAWWESEGRLAESGPQLSSPA